MGRLELMKVFVTVAEAASCRRAARALGISAPVVTRSVNALEEQLGLELLHRTTRVVRLTDAGRRYAADCARILAEVDEAEASVLGAHDEPRGTVSVTAPVFFGSAVVAPIVETFLAAHPAVSVRALLLDRVVDLVAEGLDVAVRIAHLPDSSLTAIRVGQMRIHLCGAPSYLRRRGTPKQAADLAHHDLVVFSENASSSSPPTARLLVNSAEVAVRAATAGRGLTRALSYQVAAELADGRLRAVLPELEPPPTPVHVVVPSARRLPARVRAFVDLAVDMLRAHPLLRDVG